MKTKCTQSAEILSYLKRGRSITPITALRHFGCFRLGARIWDLKKAGHKITRTWLNLGNGKRVAKYSLAT
jgi:Helix-turn-helix domain